MLATTNVALNVPLEMEHDGFLTGLPDREQAESVEKKPDPDT
jgi:hypothetical protein